VLIKFFDNFPRRVLIGIVGALLTLIFIGFLVLLALAIYWIVFAVIAAMRANEGEAYRYPYALRLIK
jgi:uncharacterized Tic20 family protein